MVKSSLAYLLSSIVSKLSPFFLLPILVNKLTASDFSLGSIYISAIGFISVVISLGTQAIIPKYYFELDEKNFSKVCANVLFCIFLITSLLSIILVFFGFLYTFDNAHYIVLLSSLGLTLYNLYLSLLRTMSKLKEYVAVEIIYTLFSFFSVYIMVNNNSQPDLYSWVFPICIVNVIFGLTSFVRFKIKIPFTLKPDREVLGKVLGVCTPLIPHSLALIIINLSDRIILNQYLDSEIVASYILAANLTVVMKVISDAFMKAWNPFYFKNVSETKLVYKYKVGFVVFYVFSALLFYYSVSFIFEWFFDKKYLLALDIIPYLTISYIIYIFYQLNVSVLLHISKTGVLKYITPFSALINVVGNYMLIPLFGVMCAALMTCMSYFIMAVATQYFIKRSR